MRTLRLLLAASLLAATPLLAVDKERATLPENSRAERSRHVWVDAEHPLTAAEQSELRSRGLDILQPVGGKRYLARVAPGLAAGRFAHPAIASLEEQSASTKIRASARRAVRQLRAASIDLVFQPDVAFDDARALVIASGATLRNPLSTEFIGVSTVEVSATADALQKLASLDEVLQLHGAERKIAFHNANAAMIAEANVVHAAPYGLTGAGIEVSIYDGGSALATHPEFGGRVILETPTAGVDEHATHVTGTVTASGVQPAAKGMAPGARIHSYAVDDNFLQRKNESFAKVSPISDNNSWGYIIGWFYDSTMPSKWTWWEGPEDFGAYGISTAALDKLTRSSGTLIVYSSGNDGDDTGPSFAPWPHHHEDDASLTWCVSSNGSGTDCNTTCNRCETTRHPSDGPFVNMSLTGSGKNLLAVGATNAQSNTIASFSSRGPTQDGRVKPDVVAKGTSQYSTTLSNGYTRLQGTSMAAPVVTGIAALVAEQWKKSRNGALPGPEMLRGLLIHGATDLGTEGPDYTYGFGMVNAKNSVDTIIADEGTGKRIKTGTVTQGQTLEFPVNAGSSTNLELTLVWSDPENIPYPEAALINDLDMTLRGPDGSTVMPWILNRATPDAGATRGVNTVDNAEQITVTGAAGQYVARVTGTRISSATPQTFVLLSNAEFGEARLACSDSFEPNNSAQQAYGRLPRNVALGASICEAADLDFYYLTVDRSGPVSVTVRGASVPVRVTISHAGGTASADAASGGSATATLNVGTGVNQPIAPVTLTVKVEPLGPVATATGYTLQTSYNSSEPTRVRPIRR
jgi:hypothetical protein